VLVVDTVDSTSHIAGIDPDDAQELLDRIFGHLNHAVDETGGLFVSYSGDGGLAVFGWPKSLEDHADRACEAAWRIQQPAAEAKPLRNMDGRPVHFRVGVHSGLVNLRWMKLEARTGIDTVGGTVHLAAALQKNAPPDRILLSSKTLELCRAKLELVRHQDLQAVRKVELGAYQLCARPLRPTAKDVFRKYRHPLVGRAAERQALQDALTGTGNRSVAIIGEPGIGKTRLAATAIDDAQSRDMCVLAFNGDSQKRTTPYSAIRSLILETLSLQETASDDEIVAALRDARIDDSPGAVTTVLLARRVEADARSNALTQTQVARALLETFERLRKDKPTLVVIDDLHLLDPESVLCLRLIAKEKGAGGLSLLVSGRPEAITDARRIAETVLSLTVLPREDMVELARQLWPRSAPRQAALEKVLFRADGIPFVLEQILLSLETETSAQINFLPETVQSVIHARLNRLSAGAKSFAQALSVLGEDVDVGLASKTLGIGKEALRRNQSELERLEIVHPSIGNSIRFRHAIVAEACAETLPGPRRQEIHRAAIDAITSIYSDLGTQYERLAYHAEGARDDQRALGYLWLAASRARRTSASGSLYLTFKRAMQCIERMGSSAESRFVDFVMMAFANLAQIGEFRKLTVYLPRAMELAQKQNRQDKVCAALCHMSLVSWFEARYQEGREQSERALEIANGLGSLPLIFAAKFYLASALYGMADMKQAIGLLRELCEMLSGKLETVRLGAAAIPGSIVRSYLCWFLMEVGAYEEGLTHAEHALDIAKREGEPYSELLARLGMGRNLIQLNRNREAVVCLDTAVTLIERDGYDAILPHITGVLATALARHGEAHRAVRIVERWLESGQEERTGSLELYYLNAGYAEALFGVGDIDKSLAAADRAVGIGRRISNPCLMVQGLGLRARLNAAASRGTSEIEADLAEQRTLCFRYGLVAEV
jgi:class 3 adenylate cyclase/tetratricopeptide (TPR) repeat protein